MTDESRKTLPDEDEAATGISPAEGPDDVLGEEDPPSDIEGVLEGNL